MTAPIWFLHGFLGLPAMWKETHRLAGEPIAEHALLPGHGPEPWFPSAGEDFFSSVDALRARFPFSEPALVVGYSMGARIALAMALRHPHIVRGAVLIGVDAGIENKKERAERIAWDDAWASRALSLDADSFADAWAALPIFETQKSLPDEMQDALRVQRASHTPRGIAWAMRALGTGRMPSLHGAIATTAVPLTFVTGSLDAKFTDKSRVICDRSRNMPHVVVDGAGHNVVLEAPEAVARVIREII